MNDQRDYLTGLHMRLMFQEKLLEEVVRSDRYGLPLSLLVIDLDYFKTINDAYGHARGDEVLAGFAAILKDSLRSVDIPFRYGGDEFVILLPHTTKQEAMVAAQRLLQTLQAAVIAGEPPLRISASIGVAELRECQPTAEALFDRADQCAYAAKLAGRGRVSGTPAAAGGKLAFDALSRLIEREDSLDILRHFLADLQEQQCGALGILGPVGSGCSRFLADAGKFARLQGYAVWLLRTSPGLRLRAYGAWEESHLPWEALPSPTFGVEELARTIQLNLARHQQAGLVVLIEDLANLDRSTMKFLNDLIWFLQTSSQVVFKLAVLFSASPEETIPLDVAFYQTTLMRPFSVQGTQMWLRGVLQWDPPSEFCAWLHEISLGLPGLLAQVLTELVRKDVLVPETGSWRVRDDYSQLLLAKQIKPKTLPIHSLPVHSFEFLGRENDLASVKGMLEKHRLVTLVGPGGIGKSRMVVQVGWEMLDRFPGGVYWVDLAPVTCIDFIPFAVLVAFGLPAGSDLSAEAQIIQYLEGKQVLLIFDNFEHLVDATFFLSRLQHALPFLKILISSRERLGLSEEQVYELAGFPVPAALAGSSLLQLFQQSLERVPGGAAPSEADQPFIRRIGEIVAGMPLGVELAAAWVPSLGIQGVVEEIEHSLDRLSYPQQVLPGGEVNTRQSGLRAIFDTFWNSLLPDEQLALSRLAVFRGSFLRAAAQRVAGLRSFFFAALVDHFYLTPKGEGRFTIHELLRQYGEEKLRSAPQVYHQACQAHADDYLTLAEKAESELVGPGQQACLKRLREELDNIRAAMGWLLVHQPTGAIRLVSYLRDFWNLQGMYQEGIHWVEAALQADAGRSSPEDRSRACIAAGILLELAGNNSAAEERYRCGIELSREAGAVRLEAEGLLGLGWLLHHHGQAQEAEHAVSEALIKAQAVGMEPLLAAGLRLASSLRGFHSKYSLAIRCARESLVIMREFGALVDTACTLNLLGLMIHSAGGQLHLACSYLEEGLEIARSLHLPQLTAICLINLANIERQRGNLEAAEDASSQAVELFQQVNERMYIAYAEARLGMLNLERGKMELGERHLRDSLRHAREAGVDMHALFALIGLAKWYSLQGNSEHAVELLGLVFKHPKAAVPRKQLGDALLAELTISLPPDCVADALARGQRLDFDEVVRSL